MADSEQALPRYGLGGAFAGERLRGGGGWDICETVHRPEGAGGALSVTVVRRATGRVGGAGPRVPLSAELAADTVASAVAMASMQEVDGEVDVNARVDELLALARRVAFDRDAWTEREIALDGHRMAAWEWQHDGFWARYCLTDELIVYAIGPVALRLETVELRRLGPDEAMQSVEHDED